MSKPIRQKGSPYWYYDFVIKGVRFHGSTGLSGKREAQSFIDRIRQEILLPDVRRPPITLDEACGLYADHGATQPSWRCQRYILTALVTGLPKDRFLHDIGQRDLIAWVARRRHGRKNSSVNREIDIMIAVWNRATKARFNVGEMPDWAALKLKVPRQTHRTLAATEETWLLGNIRADVADAVRFMLASGWRRAEVLGLRWNDIDMGALTAVTPIKGGDTVTRPLGRHMLAIIANQPRVGPFVFTYVCARTAGRIRRAGDRYPLTATVLRQCWDDAIARGMECGALTRPIRIHDLRHTRATRMLRATGNLAAVQAALKHRNIKTTLQYAHVLDDDLRAALDAIDPSQTGHSLNIPEIPRAKKRIGKA